MEQQALDRLLEAIKKGEREGEPDRELANWDQAERDVLTLIAAALEVNPRVYAYLVNRFYWLVEEGQDS